MSYLVEHYKHEGNNDTVDIDAAIKLMKQSIELAINPIEKTMTLYLFGIFYFMLKKQDDAISIFRDARSEAQRMDLDSVPESIREEAMLIQELNLDRLANTVQKAGDYQEALILFEERRTLKNSKFRQTIHRSILALSLKVDPSGQQAMRTLTSWPRADRTTFFEFPFRNGPLDRGQYIELTRPARRTGKIHVLLEILHEQEVIERHATLRILHLRQALSRIYLDLLRDFNRAKEVKLQILHMKPGREERLHWTYETFKATQDIEWRQYAALIFSQFQSTSDISIKENLLHQLRCIPRLHFQKSDELKESQVGMLMAYMLRTLG